MILVTGGAGVMGSRLSLGLLQRGHRVRILALPGDEKAECLRKRGCEIAYGDITAPDTLEGLCDGVTTVYHLAAIIIAYEREALWRINVQGTRHVVEQAARGSASHFIYVSSASADWPEGSDYARSKLAAEEIVKSQKNMQHTIVRPTLTYGPDEGQEFMLFVESLLRFPIAPIVGNGAAPKAPVLADDIVKGLLAIAHNSKAYGKTYHFSGGETVSLREFAQLILRHKRLRKAIVSIPMPICHLLAYLMEKTMRHPPLTRYAISRMEHAAAPDHALASQDLAYHPAGVSEGLEKCYPLKRGNTP